MSPGHDTCIITQQHSDDVTLKRPIGEHGALSYYDVTVGSRVESRVDTRASMS